MRRTLRLLAHDLRRGRLLVLEAAGLLQEIGDTGAHFHSQTANIDQFPSSGDPIEDERLRIYLERKMREAWVTRARRIKRLQRLARRDLRMVGGVAPIGFYGGSGGAGGGQYRPASISART